MGAEIIIKLNKTGTTINTDQTGKHAELFNGDTLVISRGTGWNNSSDAITRVEFFHTKPKYDQEGATPDGVWTENSTEGLAGKFTFDTTKSAGVIAEVKVTDAERPGADDPWWYKVTLGGEILDPEVINKSGTGTSRFTPPSGMGTGT